MGVGWMGEDKWEQAEWKQAKWEQGNRSGGAASHSHRIYSWDILTGHTILMGYTHRSYTWVIHMGHTHGSYTRVILTGHTHGSYTIRGWDHIHRSWAWVMMKYDLLLTFATNSWSVDRPPLKFSLGDIIMDHTQSIPIQYQSLIQF